MESPVLQTAFANSIAAALEVQAEDVTILGIDVKEGSGSLQDYSNLGQQQVPLLSL